MINVPLRWHGGNDYLKQWLWSLAPWCVNEHKRGYTHRAVAFYGGGQEEWQWPNGELTPGEGISETFNDLNPLLSNFFLCLKKSPRALIRTLSLTPFSEAEFERARAKRFKHDGQPYAFPAPNIQAAADFFIIHRMSRQGLGKCFATPTRRVRRGMNEQVSAYLSAVDGLADCVERLRTAEIRDEHFRTFIPRYDHRRCLDPPYLHHDIDGREIRVVKDGYAVEMTLEEHVELLDVLTEVDGKFMLQGYPSKLYASYAKVHGWRCFRKKVVCQSSAKKVKETRTECVWTNYDPPTRL
jgi:DNA adenine methylase